MKKLLSILSLSVILFSCKIVTDASFNKNNSGEISTYVNMSEFVKKAGGNMPEKTKKDINFSQKKNANLDSITLVEYLSQAEGISAVEGIADEASHKFGIKFKFENPESLNEAMNRTSHFMKIEKDSTAKLESYKYYEFTKNSLKLQEPKQKKKADQSEEEFKKQAEKMAKMLQMEWEIELKGRKVKKVTSDLKVKKEGNSKVVISLSGDMLDKRKTETIALIKFK